ncbi:MAG: tetratricopeptide repeat protein [Chitinophagales bacterium]|nr:tetratricopeptide repeat protein [Chitinophagales bacterium]
MRYLVTILTLGAFLQLPAQKVNELIVAGNDLYRQGKFEDAEKKITEAVKLQPVNVTAKFNLAAVMYKLGKPGDAKKMYTELATLEKDAAIRSKAWYNKGAILSKEKKLEESIDAYKSALKLNPDDQEARENLQKALIELKKKEPPKKKEEDNKKKKQEQQQKQQQQPKMNQKEAEQRLKLLEQKEKEVQQRLQKEKAKSGGGQSKDW